MTRWARGQGDVDQALTSRELQKITGDAANGEPLLNRAEQTLTTAAGLLDTDPHSAYILAYDAARYGCTALLAHQGLRPTSAGGHYVVERIVRAQFGDGFRPFGAMRRRRHELEYPAVVGETIHTDEARTAIDDATKLLEAARQLLPNLSLG